MVDIDFAVVEYNDSKACAIVDYKRVGADVTIDSASHKTLADLYRKGVPLVPIVSHDASGAITIRIVGAASNTTFDPVPAWLARYWPDDNWAYRVACLNPPAYKLFRTEKQVVELTEQQYVSRLYEARGLDPETYMRKITIRLGNTLPPRQ